MTSKEIHGEEAFAKAVKEAQENALRAWKEQKKTCMALGDGSRKVTANVRYYGHEFKEVI
jgi:hypothetical protein